MADLVVEFTRADSGVPVEEAEVRTEVETIGTHVVTTLAATKRENIVDLRAGADCWIAIGASPTASVGGATSRFIASGERRQFNIEAGMKVAVIAAA